VDHGSDAHDAWGDPCFAVWYGQGKSEEKEEKLIFSVVILSSGYFRIILVTVMSQARYTEGGVGFLSRNPDTLTKIKTVLDTYSGNICIVKVFNKSVLRSKKRYINTSSGMRVTSAWDEALEEWKILKLVSHPNVVRLIDAKESENKLKLYFDLHEHSVMRITTDGAFESPTDIDVLRMLSDISQALQYIHSKSICHRDVKPDNILVTISGGFILNDFGSARIISRLTNESPATTAFFTPEVCERSIEPHDGFKADIYALGLVGWCCVFGRLPYEHDEDPTELMKKIACWDFTMDPRSRSLENSIHEAIRILTTRDPSRRTYFLPIHS
jgi:serine/threonine protein kinase